MFIFTDLGFEGHQFQDHLHSEQHGKYDVQHAREVFHMFWLVTVLWGQSTNIVLSWGGKPEGKWPGLAFVHCGEPQLFARGKWPSQAASIPSRLNFSRDGSKALFIFQGNSSTHFQLSLRCHHMRSKLSFKKNKILQRGEFTNAKRRLCRRSP